MYPSEPEQAKLSSRPMSEAAPSNLAAVQGITVGHWTDSQSATGCTVTLAPPGGMRAACAVRGRACGAAATEIPEGSVGAGTGATVGKALGPRGAMKGGVGTWAARAGDVVVGALVVLNAVGNVLDANGRVLAGARGADGRFVDALGYLAQGGAPFARGGAGQNTTLAVVATNARLDRVALQALAHAAGDALARRIV